MTPYLWNIVPWTAVRAMAHGIIMKTASDPIPLVKYALTHIPNLSNSDLRSVAVLLGSPNNITSNHELLESIALRLCPDDAANFQTTITDKFFALTEKDEDDLVWDPLVEAVFRDMDPEDQGEFPEIHQAIVRKRFRAATAAFRRKRKLDQLHPHAKPKRRLAGGAKGKRNLATKGRVQIKRRRTEPPQGPPLPPPLEPPPGPPLLRPSPAGEEGAALPADEPRPAC